MKKSSQKQNFTFDIDTIIENIFEWLNYQIWTVENWWRIGKYSPPNILYKLQNFIDPVPKNESAGPDESIISFALKYMSKTQMKREAWHHYHKTKWIVRPESMLYAFNNMRTKKDQKYLSMLLQLEELLLDNYKSLLSEIEIRRIYSKDELIKSESDPVLRAHVRQSYDSYYEKL